jgi:hypothetical protein
MITRLSALKVVLAVAALYHVILGVAANVIPPGPLADTIIAMSFGAAFEINAITQHIIRLLGAFMIFVGIAVFFAFREPYRYRGIIYCLMTLFGIRIFQRAVFSGDLTQNFAIAPDRIVMQVVFFVILIGILLYLIPKTEVKVVPDAG